MRPPSRPREAAAELGRRSFRSTSEEVPRAVSFVVGLAGRTGAIAEQVSRLELAVEEWVVNLCRHAYPGGEGPIDVAVLEGRDNLTVEIADYGPPFDPTASPEPDVNAPLAEREPGGLGLLLMRRMTDEVRYRRDGPRNVVTLRVAYRQS